MAVNSEDAFIPLFPSGRFVTVQNAGHVMTYWNPCAQSIVVDLAVTG